MVELTAYETILLKSDEYHTAIDEFFADATANVNAKALIGKMATEAFRYMKDINSCLKKVYDPNPPEEE